MSTIRATYVQHGSSTVPNITLNASGQVIVASGIVSSGTFAAPSGSVSAPGVYFVGDTNTGLYSPDADQVAISTNGTGRFFINSAGRADVVSTSSVATNITSNQATTYLQLTNSTDAAGILSTGTSLGFFTSSSGTERMRLTSTGLGIGTTSPQTPFVCSNAGANGFEIDPGQSSGAVTGVNSYNRNTSAFTPLRLNASEHRWDTSSTERARIDSSGRLLVGTSSAVSGNTHVLTDTSTDTTLLLVKDNTDATRFVSTLWHKATTGNNVFFSFYTEGTATLRGSIDYNRSAGQIRYNVTSDARLKSEIQPAGTALDTLAGIKVRSYRWTETGYRVDFGFVAQELNEIVPDAVKTGDKGESVTDTWAVDNAKLVPVLTKALQEAMERIETLEAKVAALESA